jgi:hypothetical protein
MRVTLLGKRWLLRFLPLGRLRSNNERIIGLCDAPTNPKKEILIDNRLVDRELLEVLLHEMMHAVDWQKSEEFITWQARDISTVLWKLGYRRIDECPK